MYDIAFDEDAYAELLALRARERAQLLDAIEEQLTQQPLEPTRNRKALPGLVPSFAHVPPVWELRVGEWRVFYDVEEAERTVTIRAIRRKGRKTTGEIA